MSLNPSQQRIAETTEGLMVVDAGPGTGKTHTIVERYINIICRNDVMPKDVLLMTFTNNAAAEMEERIKNEMSLPERNKQHPGLAEKSKLVLTKTFDAFCLGIVMDSPDQVTRFFRMDDVMLTRSARLVDNETVKFEYFSRFLDDFLESRGAEHGDWATLASQDHGSLYGMIQKLMSMGIVPLRNGWFGNDVERKLVGDTEAMFEAMKAMNTPNPRSESDLAKVVTKADRNQYCALPAVDGMSLDEGVLMDAASEDRAGLYAFVHDVYYEYIRSSIRDNRLTFGLVAVFAFVLLYDNRDVRERNSFRYLMIDEFQDTNANQLMIAMMILTEPNLCVVGDWKQGIYGFRFVSIENITHFKERMTDLKGFLDDDLKRVRFPIGDVLPLPLDVNYRSSERIIDTAFRVLSIPGTKYEKFDKDKAAENVTMISQGRTDIGDDTDIRYVMCEDRDSEPEQVVRAIRDYVTPGRYTVHYKDGEEFKTRPLRYDDIAVICRKTEACRMIMEACTGAGIPAYLQGDLKIMSTREGKLALAWLRYVNNEGDAKGYVPILADMNYSLAEIRSMADKRIPFPPEVTDQRLKLRYKRRRITELLTLIYDYYGLDNDITQSIITTVSAAHRNSLLTISDVIRIIDEDIARDTTYNVENSLDDEAVTIMTMHKSKGLEFPAVIIPYVDSGVVPLKPKAESGFMFSDVLGMRSTKEIGDFGGYSKICRSWRTDLVRKSQHTDYSEERRLMFVALSRAKQYETLICGGKPANIMLELSGQEFSTIPDSDGTEYVFRDVATGKPDISGYPPRKPRMGVHEIMEFGNRDSSNMDEAYFDNPKGMEYGTRVHKRAYEILRGFDTDLSEYPELPRVKAIIDGLRAQGAVLRGEIGCGLPVPGTDIVLRGAIDLLAVFPDRVEVHDYKTDVDTKFEDEYVLQLSVYAHTASLFYGKPVTCVIDYLSQDSTKRFDPLPMDFIRERAERHLSR